MASTPEEIQAHVKKYILVGVVLFVMTGVTVAASYLNLAALPAILLALAIAIFKGTLVASVFMHLSAEKVLIYWTLALAAVFFVFLMFIPVSTHFEVPWAIEQVVTDVHPGGEASSH